MANRQTHLQESLSAQVVESRSLNQITPERACLPRGALPSYPPV
jgi:hypothetical protein